jgi:ABC-2 type transport system permease protein
MRSVLLIARRELGATLCSPLGFVIIAIVLAIDGLFFNLWALGEGAKFSTEVLAEFFSQRPILT